MLNSLLFSIISPIARSRLKIPRSSSFDLSFVDCFYAKIQLLMLDLAYRPFYLDLDQSERVFEVMFPLSNRFVSHQSLVCSLCYQPVGSTLDRVLLVNGSTC